MGGWLSPVHWAVIAVIAVLLFGNRLPKIAHSVGSSFTEFKKGLTGISEDVKDVNRQLENHVQDVRDEIKVSK